MIHPCGCNISIFWTQVNPVNSSHQDESGPKYSEPKPAFFQRPWQISITKTLKKSKLALGLSKYHGNHNWFLHTYICPLGWQKLNWTQCFTWKHSPLKLHVLCCLITLFEKKGDFCPFSFPYYVSVSSLLNRIKLNLFVLLNHNTNSRLFCMLGNFS